MRLLQDYGLYLISHNTGGMSEIRLEAETLELRVELQGLFAQSTTQSRGSRRGDAGRKPGRAILRNDRDIIGLDIWMIAARPGLGSSPKRGVCPPEFWLLVGLERVSHLVHDVAEFPDGDFLHPFPALIKLFVHLDGSFLHHGVSVAAASHEEEVLPTRDSSLFIVIVESHPNNAADFGWLLAGFTNQSH